MQIICYYSICPLGIQVSDVFSSGGRRGVCFSSTTNDGLIITPVCCRSIHGISVTLLASRKALLNLFSLRRTWGNVFPFPNILLLVYL